MSIDNDAREFGLHVRQGGWRLGLLVARNVVRGTGQGAKTSDQLVGGSKVSASKFAGAAGLSGHSLVLRYFDAWERAAKDGEVPAAADLSPGEEPELDVDSLPDWGHYYSAAAAAAKPEPAQPVVSEPETERPVTQPVEPTTRPAPQPNGGVHSEPTQGEQIVEAARNREPQETVIGGVGAVLKISDHATAIAASFLAIVALVQDSKGIDDEPVGLYEAVIEEIERDLEVLKSVVRSKEISIEDFMGQP